MNASVESISCAVCGGIVNESARIRVTPDALGRDLGLVNGRSRWVVCSDCGLVFQSPRPVASAIDRLYLGGEYHADRGGVPEHYIRYSLRRSVPALDWALEVSGLQPGRALDVGSGVGGALVHLRELGWEVLGVEPDPQLAKEGADRFGIQLTNSVLTDELFEKEAGFDLVFSCHVWEHLAHPLDTAKVAHNRLADRHGWICIVVPTFRHSRTRAWKCFASAHNYMFTEVSLGNILTMAGFEVVAHRFVADADSELWILARAKSKATADPPVLYEDPSGIQRELATVPLRVPLGVPGRVAKHARTLVADPIDFAGRAVRYLRGRAVWRG